MLFSFTGLFATVFAFALIKHAVDVRAKQQSDRLRVLETALKTQNLDTETRGELLEALTGRRRSQDPAVPSPVGVFMKFVAFVGWLSLCIGIAFAILAAYTGKHGFEIPATMLPCIGFGLVTYPFVVRELSAPVTRRQPSGQQT
ncbi:MAG: hypothetical protein H6836_02765 [Planctomycetes bacterium]|nr:hypothetical protein [Planctomycetota bacterium]